VEDGLGVGKTPTLHARLPARCRQTPLCNNPFAPVQQPLHLCNNPFAPVQQQQYVTVLQIYFVQLRIAGINNQFLITGFSMTKGAFQEHFSTKMIKKCQARLPNRMITNF
jgi:hypothetical protein